MPHPVEVVGHEELHERLEDGGCKDLAEDGGDEGAAVVAGVDQERQGAVRQLFEGLEMRGGGRRGQWERETSCPLRHGTCCCLC